MCVWSIRVASSYITEGPVGMYNVHGRFAFWYFLLTQLLENELEMIHVNF